MEADKEEHNTLPVHEKATGRIFFADNLRTWLVTLVVVHHVALVYGAAAPFYYVEPPYDDALAFFVLFVFVLVNQAYFMGLLFLISGHFTLGSLDHKGSRRFVRDRLIRLGIPLIAFFFVLSPITRFVGFNAMPASLTGTTTPLTWQDYPKLLGIGPMWFVEMLLIFDVGFAIWWMTRSNRVPRPEMNSEPPSYRAIAAFIVVLALISYLIRIIIPLGMSVAGFPTLSYLPEYISFFIIGIIAVRHDWLHTTPKSMGRVGFVLALVATITLFPLALTGGANFVGNGSWESAAYALWDSTVAVGMALGLITLFRTRFNYSGRFSRFLYRHSYTVSIIQAPIIVFVAVALKGLYLENLLKFFW